MASAFSVCVRARPLLENEKDDTFDVDIEGIKISILDPKVSHSLNVNRVRRREFQFDLCFPPTTPQEIIFEKIGVPSLSCFLKEARNSAVIAYGQTGSGKTHTMLGTRECPGLIPRLCQKVINLQAEPGQFTISFYEIYNEQVFDLLSDETIAEKLRKMSKLKVREHPKLGPYVQGLVYHPLKSVDDISLVLALGEAARSIGPTATHNASSRSHAVFTIQAARGFDQSTHRELQWAGPKMFLVDLAGSERLHLDATKEQIKESAHINKSLATLGNVILALSPKFKKNASKNQRQLAATYIPYRDSVLTWLLRNCFSSTAKTVMIGTVSPASSCYHETLSTLRYAHRAKNIVISSNSTPNWHTEENELICSLKAEIRRLEQLISNGPEHHTVGSDLKFCSCGDDVKRIKVLQSHSLRIPTVSRSAMTSPIFSPQENETPSVQLVHFFEIEKLKLLRNYEEAAQWIQQEKEKCRQKLRADPLSSEEPEKEKLISRIEFLETKLSRFQNQYDRRLAKLEDMENGGHNAQDAQAEMEEDSVFRETSPRSSGDDDSLHKWFDSESENSVKDNSANLHTVVIPALNLDVSTGDSQSGEKSFFESSDIEFRDEDARKFAQTYSGQNLEILGGENSDDETENDPMAKSCSFLAFPKNRQKQKKRRDGPVKPSKIADRLCPPRDSGLPNFDFLKKNEGFTAVDLFTDEDFDVDVDRYTKSYAGHSFFDQSLSSSWVETRQKSKKPRLLDLTKSHPEAAMRKSKIRKKLDLESMVGRLYPKELSANERPRFAFLRRGEGVVEVAPVVLTESDDELTKSGRVKRLSSIDSVEIQNFENSRPYAVTFDPMSSSAATTAYGSSVSSYRSPLLPRRQKLRTKQKSTESEDNKLTAGEAKKEERGSSGNSSDRPGSGKRKQIRERAEQRRNQVTKNSSVSSAENSPRKRRKKSSASSDLESSGGSARNNSLLPPINAVDLELKTQEKRLSLSHTMDMLKDAHLLAKGSELKNGENGQLEEEEEEEVEASIQSSYEADSFEPSTDDENNNIQPPRRDSMFLASSMIREKLPGNEEADSVDEEIADAEQGSSSTVQDSPVVKSAGPKLELSAKGETHLPVVSTVDSADSLISTGSPISLNTGDHDVLNSKDISCDSLDTVGTKRFNWLTEADQGSLTVPKLQQPKQEWSSGTYSDDSIYSPDDHDPDTVSTATISVANEPAQESPSREAVLVNMFDLEDFGSSKSNRITAPVFFEDSVASEEFLNPFKEGSSGSKVTVNHLDDPFVDLEDSFKNPSPRVDVPVIQLKHSKNLLETESVEEEVIVPTPVIPLGLNTLPGNVDFESDELDDAVEEMIVPKYVSPLGAKDGMHEMELSSSSKYLESSSITEKSRSLNMVGSFAQLIDAMAEEVVHSAEEEASKQEPHQVQSKHWVKFDSIEEEPTHSKLTNVTLSSKVSEEHSSSDEHWNQSSKFTGITVTTKHVDDDSRGLLGFSAILSDVLAAEAASTQPVQEVSLATSEDKFASTKVYERSNKPDVLRKGFVSQHENPILGFSTDFSDILSSGTPEQLDHALGFTDISIESEKPAVVEEVINTPKKASEDDQLHKKDRSSVYATSAVESLEEWANKSHGYQSEFIAKKHVDESNNGSTSADKQQSQDISFTKESKFTTEKSFVVKTTIIEHKEHTIDVPAIQVKDSEHSPKPSSTSHSINSTKSSETSSTTSAEYIVSEPSPKKQHMPRHQVVGLEDFDEEEEDRSENLKEPAYKPPKVPGNPAFDKLYGMLAKCEATAEESMSKLESKDEEVLNVTVVDGVPYITMMPKPEADDAEYLQNFKFVATRESALNSESTDAHEQKIEEESDEGKSTSESDLDETSQHGFDSYYRHDGGEETSLMKLRSRSLDWTGTDEYSKSYPPSTSVRTAFSMPDLIFTNDTDNENGARNPPKSLDLSPSQIDYAYRLQVPAGLGLKADSASNSSLASSDSGYEFLNIQQNDPNSKKAVSWSDITGGQSLEIGPSKRQDIAPMSPMKPIIKHSPPIPPRPTTLSRKLLEDSGYSEGRFSSLNDSISFSYPASEDRPGTSSSKTEATTQTSGGQVVYEAGVSLPLVGSSRTDSQNSLNYPPSPSSSISFEQLLHYQIRRLYEDLRFLVKERDQALITMEEITQNGTDLYSSPAISAATKDHCKEFQERVFKSKIDLDTRIADLWAKLTETTMAGLLSEEKNWIVAVASSRDLTLKKQSNAASSSSMGQTKNVQQNQPLLDNHEHGLFALDYQKKLAELRRALVGTYKDIAKNCLDAVATLELHGGNGSGVTSGYDSNQSSELFKQRKDITASWVTSVSTRDWQPVRASLKNIMDDYSAGSAARGGKQSTKTSKITKVRSDNDIAVDVEIDRLTRLHDANKSTSV